ncbi:MAG: hypothetical protein WBG92_16230 [Thiohalocapsa sp.]
MARRYRQSTFEDLIELASLLPWWVSLILALASYLILHPIASSPIAPPTITVSGSPDLSPMIVAGFYRGLAQFGQYLFPLIFGVASLSTGLSSLFGRSDYR